MRYMVECHFPSYFVVCCGSTHPSYLRIISTICTMAFGSLKFGLPSNRLQVTVVKYTHIHYTLIHLEVSDCKAFVAVLLILCTLHSVTSKLRLYTRACRSEFVIRSHLKKMFHGTKNMTKQVNIILFTSVLIIEQESFL